MFGVKYIIVLWLALWSSFVSNSESLVYLNVRLTSSQFKFINDRCKTKCINDNYCRYNCIQNTINSMERLRKTQAPSLANDN